MMNVSIANAEYAGWLQDHEKMVRAAVFSFPLLFTTAALLLKSHFPWWYRHLMVKEDAIIENLTFALYFLSVPLAIGVAVTHFKNGSAVYGLLYVILSLGLFFIAMEEISWGQRIFNLSTPSLFEDNYQNEINLHNYEAFPLHLLYIIVGFYGAFSRAILPNGIKRKYRRFIEAVTPDRMLFFYFFIVGFLYLYYEYLSPVAVDMFGQSFGWGNDRFITGKDQEPAEFLLAAGFFLFVLINRTHQWSSGGEA